MIFRPKWVREHYAKAIESALNQVVGSTCELILQVKEISKERKAHLFEQHSDLPSNFMSNDSYESGPSSNYGVASGPIVRSNADHPDLRYVFDNFVVGASNQFAHASACGGRRTAGAAV